MTKFLVTHLVSVEVEAENALKAEAKLTSTFSGSALETVGKVVRTHWSADVIEDKPFSENADDKR